MSGMQLKIDRAGRIVVPKAIRERLGLEAGTDLEIIEGSGGVLVRPAKREPLLVREGKLLVHTGKLPGNSDPARMVEEERETRIRELWSQ